MDILPTNNFGPTSGFGRFSTWGLGVCFLLKVCHSIVVQFSRNQGQPEYLYNFRKKASKHKLKTSKQRRLREFGDDPKLSSADRGWIKQERNLIKKGERKTIRVPPGKLLAHRRGLEAHKGFDHKHSKLQSVSLERLQHKHDDWGRLNKTPKNYEW